MMQLVPLVSVSKGRTARLVQGNIETEKIYDVSPLNVALEFQEHGAQRLHLVDLDGARKGAIVNYPTLELIKGHAELDINFTGGLYTDGDIGKAFEFGSESITAATVALTNRDLFVSWMMSYGREKIALGADSLKGMVRVGGWQKETKVDLFEHIEYFYDRGLKYVKCTDIEKDGSLEGPAIDLYKQIIKRFPNLCLFAMGGVRGIDDIYRLEDAGVYGTIFGKAYYEGRITMKEVEKFYSRKS